MAKRKIFIANHGVFDQFGLNISLPAIIELTEEQIVFIKNTGLYKLEELTKEQVKAPKRSELDIVEGDRFSRKRSISVNELTFKAPIMATAYAKEAKGALVVRKGSIYEKQALDKLAAKNQVSQQQANQKVVEEGLSTSNTKKNKKQSTTSEPTNTDLFIDNEKISTN